MAVSADGGTADASGAGRASSMLRQPLLVGFTLVVLVGVIAGVTWIKLARGPRFDDSSCSSSVQDQRQGGCVASLPIQDIGVKTTATVGLSPKGDTLLLGGPLRGDNTKVVLAGFNVADRRETWRTPLDGIGHDVNLSVSADGGKAAVWGGPKHFVRIVNLPGGTHILDVPATPDGLYVGPYFDVSF
jgi:hypothetical protein